MVNDIYVTDLILKKIVLLCFDDRLSNFFIIAPDFPIAILPLHWIARGPNQPLNHNMCVYVSKPGDRKQI